MSWLIVAKMPLLISSRMTSATLTPRSSPSSLTVIVAGSSTAPRSRGSTTWTAVCANAPSRRWGFRGPRRPLVPLLLRAIERPPAHDSSKVRREADGHVDLEGATQPALLDRARDAAVVTADVGTATVCLAGRVVGDLARGRPDDPQQLALVLGRAAPDARSGRRRPTLERRPGGAYDVTSSAAALALFRARGLVALAAPAAANSFSASGAASSAGVASVAGVASAAGAAWGAGVSSDAAAGAASSAAAFASASATDTSLRMSMRQPVSRAA